MLLHAPNYRLRSEHNVTGEAFQVAVWLWAVGDAHLEIGAVSAQQMSCHCLPVLLPGYATLVSTSDEAEQAAVAFKCLHCLQNCVMQYF
jgi:hypothetical protein